MRPIEEPTRWLDPRSEAPDELRTLLARSRQALDPTPDELARLNAFVAGAASTAAAGAGAATLLRVGGHAVTRSGAVKLAAVLVLGGVGAGVGWSAVRSGAPAAVAPAIAAPVGVPRAGEGRAGEVRGPADEGPLEPPTATDRAAPAAPVPTSATALAASVAKSPEVAPTQGTPRAPAPGASRPAPEPAAAPEPTAPPEPELALLDRARASLASDPAAALRAAEEHRARYPGGVFAQEREVLAIEALVRLGRRDEARARASAFARAFPTSAHRRRIAVLLGDDAGAGGTPPSLP